MIFERTKTKWLFYKFVHTTDADVHIDVLGMGGKRGYLYSLICNNYGQKLSTFFKMLTLTTLALNYNEKFSKYILSLVFSAYLIVKSSMQGTSWKSLLLIRGDNIETHCFNLWIIFQLMFTEHFL